ncbi:MAG: hypothetical protein NZM35_01660 [Chitinophagales bacterium]|nr:hypothetical protein [Chitinophagales bacterium]MDW8418210.1 hypothetical protein [Chitinophagales bacterium]
MYIKLLHLVLPLWFTVSSFSQAKYDGDLLFTFLGKEAQSPELKELKAGYRCQMANENHYLSNEGIELILSKGVLYEIHLYASSAVYGNFTGKLPKNLRFGMFSSQVKALLGKPLVSYNSGYCEYEIDNYILSCWFEAGKLQQVGISLK